MFKNCVFKPSVDTMKWLKKAGIRAITISKGCVTEEVIEFYVDFIPDLKVIGVPESRHEGDCVERAP